MATSNPLSGNAAKKYSEYDFSWLQATESKQEKKEDEKSLVERVKQWTQQKEAAEHGPPPLPNYPPPPLPPTPPYPAPPLPQDPPPPPQGVPLNPVCGLPPRLMPPIRPQDPMFRPPDFRPPDFRPPDFRPTDFRPPRRLLRPPHMFERPEGPRGFPPFRGNRPRMPRTRMEVIRPPPRGFPPPNGPIYNSRYPRPPNRFRGNINHRFNRPPHQPFSRFPLEINPDSKTSSNASQPNVTVSSSNTINTEESSEIPAKVARSSDSLLEMPAASNDNATTASNVHLNSNAFIGPTIPNESVASHCNMPTSQNTDLAPPPELPSFMKNALLQKDSETPHATGEQTVIKPLSPPPPIPKMFLSQVGSSDGENS